MQDCATKLARPAGSDHAGTVTPARRRSAGGECAAAQYRLCVRGCAADPRVRAVAAPDGDAVVGIGGVVREQVPALVRAADEEAEPGRETLDLATTCLRVVPRQTDRGGSRRRGTRAARAVASNDYARRCLGLRCGRPATGRRDRAAGSGRGRGSAGR